MSMSISGPLFEKPKFITKRRPYMRTWYSLMRLVLIPLQRTMAATIPINDGALVAHSYDIYYGESSTLSEEMNEENPIAHSQPTSTVTMGLREVGITKTTTLQIGTITYSEIYTAPQRTATTTHSTTTTSAHITPTSTNIYQSQTPQPNITNVPSTDSTNKGAAPWIGGSVIAGVFLAVILGVVIYINRGRLFYCFRGRGARLKEKQQIAKGKEKVEWVEPSAYVVDLNPFPLSFDISKFATNLHLIPLPVPNPPLDPQSIPKTVPKPHAGTSQSHSKEYVVPPRFKNLYNNPAEGDNGDWLENWRKSKEYDLRVNAAAVAIVGLSPAASGFNAPRFQRNPQVPYSYVYDTFPPDLEAGMGVASGSRHMY